MRAPPIPVTVVTGFLGAGKTTLVNRWLADFAPGAVAVVVNEHGAVGVDGELLAARARTVVEITGGCVCCATQAELMTALERLASTDTHARVLLETSGAASPAGVVGAIARGGRHGAFALDGVVTVVDAARAATGELEAHDLAFEQIGYADVIVLSRADVCAPDRLEAARLRVGTHNAAARVLASPPAAPLLDVLGGRSEALTRSAELARARESAPRAAPHPYASVALVAPGELDGERFGDFVEGALARVAGRVFRTKGILAFAGVAERVVVQGVADGMEVTFGAPWGDAPRWSRLVVVGFGLERAALEEAFAACRVG